MVEVVGRNIPFTELKALRRQFGSGNAGRSAFKIIAKGAQCEGLGNGGDGKSGCIMPASLTVDFDAPRVNSLVQVPSCSDCKGKIESAVRKDFAREGSFFSFSTNGRGRF